MSEERRKRAARVYYSLAVVMIAIVGLLLCLTVFFRVDNVEVRGVTLYTTDQIINVGGAETGMNLIRTDTDRVVKRLQGLVYLDEVVVEKDSPSTIVITCKEAVKAADIEYEDEYYVLSYSGKILESGNRHPTGGIPVIKGFALDEEELAPGSKLSATDEYSVKVLLDLLRQLDKQGFKNIGMIDMTSRADIIVDYDDRITMKLRGSADLEHKLQSFALVIESLNPDFTGVLIYNGSDIGISAIAQERTTTTTAPQEQPAGTDTSLTESQGGWEQDTETTTTAETWWTPEETTTETQTWWTPDTTTQAPEQDEVWWTTTTQGWQ